MSRHKWKDHGADFSPCRRWRYTLWRSWEDEPTRSCAFIGLNPSTADEINNDPTVTRCINFAKRWGFGKMWMLNIFAYRSTDPRQLYKIDDPIGYPDNDAHIDQVLRWTSQAVLCWGAHGDYKGRGQAVLKAIRNHPSCHLFHFGLTRSGQPRHPLYLPNNSELIKL